jgi:hypothetical protein
MLNVLRRYGLDKWGPLTAVLFFIVAVVTITVAVIIIVTRPSVDEVIKAAQAIATAAIALGVTIAAHAHLRASREVADASREAAAIGAEAATAPLQTVNVAGVAGSAVRPTETELAAGPSAIADEEELRAAPRLESATTPDRVEEHHGPDDLPAQP